MSGATNTSTSSGPDAPSPADPSRLGHDPATPERSGRIGNTLAWTSGVLCALVVASILSQAGTWGLVVAVVLLIATVGAATIVVGSSWSRAGAAMFTAVLGGASFFFAGPAAYETYMASYAETSRAFVADVSEAEGESRQCLVLELDGPAADGQNAPPDTEGASPADAAERTHRLDQRGNCFDHIRRGEMVTLYRDPMGLLPPRLEDPPGSGGPSVGLPIAGGLLAGTAGSMLYGGLRRRDRSVSTGRPRPMPTAKPSAVWLTTPASARKRVPPFEVSMPFIEATDAGGVTSVLGYAERADSGIVLWRDTTNVLARVSAADGSTARTARFDVTDEHGQPIATIARRRAGLLPIRRTRWTITRPDAPPAVGYKGSLGWWLVWWLTLPLQVVLVPLSVLTLFADGEVFQPVRSPLRTKWRVDGAIVLEYRRRTRLNHQSASDHLQLTTEWDPRLTAVLAALIRRYDSWLGERWGGRKPGRHP